MGVEGDLGFFAMRAATGRLSALWCGGLLEVDTSRSGAEGDLGFLAWVEVLDFPAF